MTNVNPDDLNYHHYDTNHYDKDIVNSIPGHIEMHEIIGDICSEFNSNPKITELGVGTGITTLVIAQNTKNSDFHLIDFSEQMIKGAKEKLKGYNCNYILGDYSKIELPNKNDAIVTVIGLHHQDTDDDKTEIFKKIYDSLNKDGFFIFGDLMTYDDKVLAAYNEALHYHFLVENAENKEALKDWAYHHKYLNPIVSWEKNVTWMEEIGFRVEVKFTKFNTFLLLGFK
jgi:tRNA (cmo5U34)-methyltransferase